MEWIKDNWAGIVAAFAAGLVFAKAIATLTPTDKDDTIIAKITDWFSNLTKKS